MLELWHGTLGGYTNHRCRCDKCRAAWRAYMRKYMRDRRANALKSVA